MGPGRDAPARTADTFRLLIAAAVAIFVAVAWITLPPHGTAREASTSFPSERLLTDGCRGSAEYCITTVKGAEYRVGRKGGFAAEAPSRAIAIDLREQLLANALEAWTPTTAVENGWTASRFGWAAESNVATIAGTDIVIDRLQNPLFVADALRYESCCPEELIYATDGVRSRLIGVGFYVDVADIERIPEGVAWYAPKYSGLCVGKDGVVRPSGTDCGGALPAVINIWFEPFSVDPFAPVDVPRNRSAISEYKTVSVLPIPTVSYRDLITAAAGG